MSVRINQKNKTIRIGVGDLVRAVSESGSIGGKNLRFAGHWGRQFHRMVTEQIPLNARSSEVSVSHSLQVNGYTAIVSGRIDLLLTRSDEAVVQEIKTVTLDGKKLEKAAENDFPAFRAQLLIYLYLLDCSKKYEKLLGQLVLVSLLDGTIVEVPVTYEQERVFLLIRSVLLGIIRDNENLLLKREQRRSLAGHIQLPFKAARKHQDEAAEAVFTALDAKNNLILSAPTGMGKTAAVLTSVLRFALANDLRIFWASGKSSHQRIVAETLRLLLPQDAQFSALFMMAKEKLCLSHSLNCEESICRFSHEFSAKLRSSDAVNSLLQQKVILPQDVSNRASESEMCPFELSLRCAIQADFVVGDYNYIFDPVTSLRRLFPSKSRKDWILIIDEAHNLYPRARNCFSSELSSCELQQAEQMSTQEPLPILAAILADVKEHLKRFRRKPRFEQEGKQLAQAIQLDKKFFSRIGARLDEALPAHFLDKLRAGLEGHDDPFDNFVLRLDMFCKILSLEGDFAHIYDPSAGGLFKVVCLDPSSQLKDAIASFHSTIAVSATLEPQEFFRDVLGFPSDETIMRSFPSPFHRENRKVLIVPAIATTYRVRKETAAEVARLITKVAGLRNGNYAAFFPSYAYLNLVSAHLRDFPGRLFVQREGMTQAEIEQTLDNLKDREASNLILAVQGGSLAEGVDYADSSLSGVFIVGVGLPQPSLENQLQKAHFDEKHGAGFQYAYLYTGMNRVVQSAGRIIRSENDTGFIILIGRRYASPEYYSLLPRDWYAYSIEELISSDPVADIRAFWNSF